MKDLMIIQDPKTAKLFADRTRRQILILLRVKEMSIYQLAKALNKPVSAISYHLRLLESSGLIEKYKEVVKGNLIEKYYRATAKRYIISYSLSDKINVNQISDWSYQKALEASKGLRYFGYSIDKDNIDKVAKIFRDFLLLKRKVLEELARSQVQNADINGFSFSLLLEVLEHLQLFNSREYVKLLKELNKILKKR